MTSTVDLTGGEAKIIGNRGDTHTLRLANPVGQDLIIEGGLYSAEFVTSTGKVEVVEVDITDLAIGVLLVPITINSGTYRIRRLNPRRTIMVVEVETR